MSTSSRTFCWAEWWSETTDLSSMILNNFVSIHTKLYIFSSTCLPCKGVAQKLSSNILQCQVTCQSFPRLLRHFKNNTGVKKLVCCLIGDANTVALAVWRISPTNANLVILFLLTAPLSLPSPIPSSSPYLSLFFFHYHPYTNFAQNDSVEFCKVVLNVNYPVISFF